MLKKIKKEHIILIVLVIVVLLLIFINIKNKRGLREGFFNQNINYQIVFSTLDEENRILDKIGIIGRNYNNEYEYEEIMLKLFDCKEKEEIINFKGKYEYNNNNTSNGVQKYTNNDKDSITITYPITENMNPPNMNMSPPNMNPSYMNMSPSYMNMSPSYMNMSPPNMNMSPSYMNPTYMNDTYNINIKYSKESKPYKLKEMMPNFDWELEKENIKDNEININKEDLIELFNNFYSKKGNKYKCIAKESPTHAPTQSVHAPTQSVHAPTQSVHAPTQLAHAPTQLVHAPTQSTHAPSSCDMEEELNPEKDCFIGDYVIENFGSQNCTEKDRLKSIWSNAYANLNGFKNLDSTKNIIKSINADTNFKNYINSSLGKPVNTYSVTDYFKEDDIDKTPIHQQYSGLRRYIDENENIIEIDIFKLNANKVNKTITDFTTMYKDNTVKPIWFQLFLKDGGFPTTTANYNLEVFRSNIETLHNSYIGLLSSASIAKLNHSNEKCENLNEPCPSPAPECSSTIVKFRITDFNTPKLKKKIEEKLKTILGTEITFTYEEVKFYFTITINGKNIEHHIQIKEKREHIKNVMTDIYYKHLQDLYISSKKEMYNIPKERLKVFVLHGSLKIVLEILPEEYAQGPSETSIEEQELSDIEEWKQFMSTFNMPGGTENIVQYEPEGVSGIFAPYIKIV